MTEQGQESERPSAGMRILKWLAPLLSGAVLGYLIVRVSTCEPERESSTPQRIAPPPSAPLDLAQLEGAPMAPRADAGPPPKVRDGAWEQKMRELSYMGGSKSGFGGLGLRGSGRSDTDAAVPSLGDFGAPNTNAEPARPPREVFIGGSKSGTLDIGRIREGTQAEPAP